MKYLNRNIPNCPLNIKLRKWYKLKQDTNNMIKDEKLKRSVMKYCDKQINLCWLRNYTRKKGYEI